MNERERETENEREKVRGREIKTERERDKTENERERERETKYKAKQTWMRENKANQTRTKGDRDRERDHRQKVSFCVWDIVIVFFADRKKSFLNAVFSRLKQKLAPIVTLTRGRLRAMLTGNFYFYSDFYNLSSSSIQFVTEINKVMYGTLTIKTTEACHTKYHL